jgi:Ca2+-binding RTX toxin-like protein
MKRARTNPSELMTALEPRQLMAADLVVSAITMNQQFLATNEGTVATFTIKNQGDVAAPAGVSMRAFFSRDGVYGNDDDRILPTFKTTVDLKPGQTTTINMESRATAQQPGDFRVGGFIDSRNIVGEGNEKNNVRMTSPNMVRYYNDLEDHMVTGTKKSDKISIWKANGRALVDVNGTLYGIQGVWLYKPVTIEALAGNDKVVADVNYPYKLIVNGGVGNDTITGGASNDTLSGGNHKDRIAGGGGNDVISGGLHDDVLFGDGGNDSMSGGAGNDQLTGGIGTNVMSGGDGDDTFFSAGNSSSDTIGGGDGNDTASADDIDIVDRIETR